VVGFDNAGRTLGIDNQDCINLGIYCTDNRYKSGSLHKARIFALSVMTTCEIFHVSVFCVLCSFSHFLIFSFSDSQCD
jgi:hypothetical protein